MVNKDVFIIQSNDLIKELNEILLILIKIPIDRKIICNVKILKDKDLLDILIQAYQVDRENSDIFIFKPRYSPDNKPLDTSLRSKVLKLFSDIKIYFNNFFVFKNLQVYRAILNENSQEKNYKKSLFCLLEENTQKTDEIYGDYIYINKLRNEPSNKLIVDIYATRRTEIREEICIKKEFENIEATKEYLMDYVKNRTRQEIEIKIEKLLGFIKLGIQEYESLKKKFPSINQKISIIEMIKIGEEKIYVNPFDANFYLGYAMEKWVKSQVYNSYPYNIARANIKNVLDFAQSMKILPFDVIELCHQIRIEYNDTKHDSDHEFDTQKIRFLYQNFKKIIENGL